MKGIFSISVCLVALTSLYGGDPIQKWYQGTVVLSNQQVLVGDISVYPTYDLIMLRSEKGIMTLAASKIKAFYFYDSAANINRKFIAYEHPEYNFPQYKLYEVVVVGPILVLRKQVIYSRGEDNANDFNYFILFESTLIELQKFKRLVYPKIVKQSKELIAHIKRNRLNPNQMGNAIKIIQHYNGSSIQADLAMN